MAKNNIQHYLRAQRRAWGLTQDEVGCLVGIPWTTPRNRVSALELGKAQPKSGEILAYSLIFGARPSKLFPHFYEIVEETVMRGAAKLERKLRDDTSRAGDRKRHLLDLIGSRASGKSSFAAV